MTANSARPRVGAASDGSLTAGLARILARPVPRALRARAALHVLDWVGCSVLGATTPAGRIVAALGERLGAGPSHAIGVGRRGGADAAFINGAFGNVLEMDDVHRTSILHPGPVVVPAALAVAERDAARPDSMLDAIVRGYEAVIRVGRSVGRAHYRHWHTTSTCGPFGAAAAAASLLGLDPVRTMHALGSAGTQSAGPWQCRLEGAMSKQLHTARAAHAGVVAADLAGYGFTGPEAILEGELGLYAATCPDADPGAVLASPGTTWLIAETSFKPWPACRHAHATIDAALALRERLAGATPARIEVRTYADAVALCDNPCPRTGLEAKFSLQHCVAIVLLDGTPTLAGFEPGSLDRADVAALRERVGIEVAEPYAAAYPAHYGAGVSARLRGGGVVSCEVPDALGDPDNPLGVDAIEGKARTLMRAAGLDEARAIDVVAACRALADGGAIADLTGCLP